MTRSASRASTLLLLSLIACGGSDSDRLRVGREPVPVDAGGGVAGAAGTLSGGVGGVGALGGDVVPGGQALSAHIEDVDEMTIEVVTLGCAGECKRVLAVARGGVDPYTFAWNDGVTTAEREICASADTAFTVTVSDTPYDGEFAYAGQRVTATVTARVVACPEDGGVPAWDACLGNPSFESSPGGWVTPWLACAEFVGAGVRVVDESSVTGRPGAGYSVAPDGQTFVSITASASDFPIPGGLGQALCGGAIPAELDAAPLAFTFDAMLLRSPDATTKTTDFKLEIHGGDAPCDAVRATPRPSPIWTSPPLSTNWTTYCVSLDARAAGASLSFYAIADPETAIDTDLLLDHITFVESCP